MDTSRVECRMYASIRHVPIGFVDERRSYTRAFARYALELSRYMAISGCRSPFERQLRNDQRNQKELSAEALQPAEAECPRT
jgi:hypothetical protein